tara:strand:- start:37 stop:207 length:171 start_codon:yes stop_codon:yes gene_type:complete
MVSTTGKVNYPDLLSGNFLQMSEKKDNLRKGPFYYLSLICKKFPDNKFRIINFACS